MPSNVSLPTVVYENVEKGLGPELPKVLQLRQHLSPFPRPV